MNVFHPLLLHFSVERMPLSSFSTSISRRRCALSTSQVLNRRLPEFSACRPLSDEETKEYCLVVAGNKTDLEPSSIALLCQKLVGWESKTNSSRCQEPHLVA